LVGVLLGFLLAPFRGRRSREVLPALALLAICSLTLPSCDCNCCCGSCDDDGSECCDNDCDVEEEEETCPGGLCPDEPDAPPNIPFEEVGQINEDTSTLAGGLKPTEGEAATGSSSGSKGQGSAATAGGAGPMGGGPAGGAAGGLGAPKPSDLGGGGGGGGPAGGGAGGRGMTVDPTQAAAQAGTGGAFDTTMDEASYEGGGGGAGKDGGGGGAGALFGGAKDGGAPAGGEDLGFGGEGVELAAMLGEDPDDYFSRIDPTANLFKIVQRRYEKKQASWILDDSSKAADEGRQRLEEIKKGSAPKP